MLGSPVLGVVSTVLILGERPTGTDIIGFALIFAASACVLLIPQRAGAADLRLDAAAPIRRRAPPWRFADRRAASMTVKWFMPAISS